MVANGLIDFGISGIDSGIGEMVANGLIDSGIGENGVCSAF